MSNLGESISYKKRLAVIPARGGSKRIPGKNLIEICGQPIINYPIAAAIAANLFHEILVSSDDEKILRHAESIGGVTTSIRPLELSDDHSPIYSTLKYEVEQKERLGQFFDEVWLISATACMISSIDLIKLALEFENKSGSNSMLAVTEYEVPIQWAMTINEVGRLNSLDFASFRVRSQDLEKYYHDAGCLAVFLPSVFQNYPEGIPEGNFDPFVLDRGKAIDIDYPVDLEFAEALLLIRKKLL